MKSYLQEGKNLEITAPYARASGEGVQVGAGLFGVCLDAVSSGAASVIATEGCYLLAKATAQAYTIGQRLFWDNSAKNLTATSTANLAVGIALNAAASADTTAQVKLVASTPAGT